MKRIAVIVLIAIAVMLTIVPLLLAWASQTLVSSPRAAAAARAFDQFGNAVLGGDPQRTLTERAGPLMATRRWACVLCKLLDVVDAEHCTKYGYRWPPRP